MISATTRLRKLKILLSTGLILKNKKYSYVHVVQDMGSNSRL